MPLSQSQPSAMASVAVVVLLESKEVDDGSRLRNVLNGAVPAS